MDNSVQSLYEDIDLRPYFETLLRQWRLVLIIPVVASLLAFAVARLMPEKFEATALTAVTRPRFTLADGAVDPAAPYRAYPELAMSDQIMEQLFTSLTRLPPGIETPDDLKAVASAENGADPSLIRLVVEVEDSELAAALVNQWADIFIKTANFVFGNQGTEAVAFFESQLDEAERKLAASEQKLIEFQRSNQKLSLTNKLAGFTEDQLVFQTDLRQIASILQEVQLLRNQIAAAAGTENSVDSLATLMLQTKTLTLDADESLTSAPQVQLQLVAGDLALSRTQQLQILNDLEALLIEKQSATRTGLQAVDGEILKIQVALQQSEAELNQLLDSRDIARETFQSLSRKVEEVTISSQTAASQVQLASYASPPQNPSGLAPLIQAVLAGFISLLAFIAFSFLRIWWEQGKAS